METICRQLQSVVQQRLIKFAISSKTKEFDENFDLSEKCCTVNLDFELTVTAPPRL